MLLAGALAGCASSASLRAARAGNYDEARAAIAQEAASSSIDDGDAVALARAVAEGEVARASGASGPDRIRALAICARAIDGALEAKAEGSDEASAAAAAVRLEARLASGGEIERYAAFSVDTSALPEGSRAAWRAVGARALMGPADGAVRRKLTTDGDEKVRLGALRAAFDAADPADTDAVLEAARLDPYPLARTIAIRAAGAVGSERVVLALKDLWSTSEEPERQGIADAWATPRSADVGGRRELLWASTTERGSPAIAAAYALVRLGGAGASDATAVLVRAIDGGSPRERRFAIRVAPLEAEPVRAALARAKDDPDETVAVEALARRLEASPEAGGAPAGSAERKDALARLMKVAQGTTTSAASAKASLARAGAREVVPVVLRDLASKDARTRQAAGEALVELGELGKAAPLAVDEGPQVRASVACAILRGR